MEKDAINEPAGLEDILNFRDEKPKPLTYALIKRITNTFDTPIGSGGYGDVYLGCLGNNKKVAVKKVKYNEQSNVEELFNDEIHCFTRAKHENVARLLGYCAEIPREMSDTENILVQRRKRFLCLEYAPYGDLQAYIEGPDEVNWSRYYQMIMGICQGLKNIHEQEIIHLDMKPSNILLDSYGRAQITDFGVSQCLSKTQSPDNVKCPPGTDGFKAPEWEERKEVTYKSDIYALGVTIAHLLMRTDSDSVKKWLEENLNDKNCPKEKRSFIDIARNCMKDDPNERYTLEQTIKELEKMGVEDLKIDDSEEVLKLFPHEMPYRLFGNAVSSTLNVINRTGQYVAYKISRRSNGERYASGIIVPRSTKSYEMSKEASETFLVQSTVVPKGNDDNEAYIPADMFETKVRGRRIYEVDVMVDAPHQPTLLEGDTSSEELLDVHPSTELQVPFEPKKSMPCFLQLTNRTDKFVRFILRGAVWVIDDGNRDGVVPPKSTYTLAMTSEKRRHGKDRGRQEILTLSSCICDQDSIEADCEEFFQSAHQRNNKSVKQRKLKAVYSSSLARGEMKQHGEFQLGMKIITVMLQNNTPISYLEHVEANPREPWVAAVHGHNIALKMDYEAHTQTVITPTEVRSQSFLYDFRPKFFTKREWTIAVSPDKGYIDIYSYKMERISRIRASTSSTVKILAVHPTKLSFLCTGERKEIKLWGWDEDEVKWKSKETFVVKGYKYRLCHFVFNPKDTENNSFAGIWHDRTIKFWDRGSSQCSHTLCGHDGEVNCLDFFTREHEDKQQYLITGSNDNTAKIWDIQTMTCVHTLDGFISPVVRVFGHPSLPLLITGTKEGLIHVWSSADFRIKWIFDICKAGEVRSIAVACPDGLNRVVIGQSLAVSIIDFGDETGIKGNGQNFLGTFKFRDPESEAGKDITRSGEKNSSLVQVKEPLVSQQRQPPLETATGCDGSTSVPAINEINRLLCKVDTLMQKVPTTGERLSRISRIFPPGRGPCAEAVQEAADYDAGVLASLAKANFYIRKSISMLGKKQDVICRVFEREAAILLESRERNQQDGGEASGDATVAKMVEEEATDTEESLSSYNNDDIDGDSLQEEEAEESLSSYNNDDIDGDSLQEAAKETEESLSSYNNDDIDDDNEASEEVSDDYNINSADGAATLTD